MCGFVLCFLVIFGKLVDATVIRGIDGEPKLAAADAALSTARADIVDRNGQTLATSLPTVSLYADAIRVIEPDKTADKLIELFPDLDRAHLISDLKSNKRFTWIKRHLTPQQYAAANTLGLPGIEFQNEFRRVYPHGALFAHALGFLGVDQEGLAGLEKTMDARLRTDSTPLKLSVDARLQYIVKREVQSAIDSFTAVGGAGMVMDAKTGEVMAMVSLPDFDPHEPGLASDDAKFNRDTLGVYEMGSTFKIFNTAMALDSGQVKMNDVFDTTHNIRVGRFTITDFHPAKHNYNVSEIMEESSNIGSVHMFERVGTEWQQAFLTKLGFTKQAKLEVPERGDPMVPRPWRDVNSMTIAFGHGMAVSPLHLVRGVSAIVNGGELIQPTLLKRPANQPIVGERVISEQTSILMRGLMRLVVTGGTAKSADAPGYEVGGKTGTADKINGHGYKGGGRLSSFVGAFPISNPKYIVFVMVDEPHPNAKSYGYATGGWVAAPAVGKIVSQIAPILGIAPVFAPGDKAGILPDSKFQTQEVKATAPNAPQVEIDNEDPQQVIAPVEAEDDPVAPQQPAPQPFNREAPAQPFAQPIAYSLNSVMDGNTDEAAMPSLPAAATQLRR